MKKLFIILAAVAMVFVSCSKDSSNTTTPVNPTPTIADQVVGKWLYIESDGQPEATNELSVTNFVMEGSTLKAYTSQAIKRYSLWAYQEPTEVQIDGDKLILTMQKDNITTEEEMSNINVGDDLNYTSNYVVLLNGEVVEDLGPFELRCVKVNDDFSQDIIGLWECTELIGDVTYNDANARLEFFDDGTYNYYRKDADDVWQLVPRELNEYFVDGTYFATRWSADGGRINYESWIIASLADGNMEWNSVRIKADGTAFNQVMKWMKIDQE